MLVQVDLCIFEAVFSAGVKVEVEQVGKHIVQESIIAHVLVACHLQLWKI